MTISTVRTKPANKNISLVNLTDGKETFVERTSSGKRTIVLGVPNRGKVNLRRVFILARQVVSIARANKINSVAIDFNQWRFPLVKISDGELAERLAVNMAMADFQFVVYKTPPKEGWGNISRVVVFGLSGKTGNDVKDGLRKGQIIAEAVNETRALSNTPGGEMTPKLLANAAKSAATGTKVKVTVLGKKQIEGLKMGGVLGVAQGSGQEPQFIVMEYWGGAKDEKPVVLVGKGVTFDTGGINLKPSEHISDMQMDMSGGAAVIHSVVLAAKLGLSKNVIGLVPAVENMPSGSSYRPGDILRTMSGKTIEVLNTDAEGRIILADALTYASRYSPRLVVDVATLTGAAAVALGQRVSAIFTNDTNLEQMFRDLGEASGDYVWPLPMWEEYEEEIKGTFGDWANIGKTRYGGAIHGAVFLKQFIGKYPWVHIDIAPRMTAAEGEYLAKGAVGAPVRLLIKLIDQY